MVEMTSQKKLFDLSKPDDISEIHKILYDSDSDDFHDESDEDDAIIPDFRDDLEVNEECDIEDIRYHSTSPDQHRLTSLTENEDHSISSSPVCFQDSFPSSDSEDCVPLVQIYRAE